MPTKSEIASTTWTGNHSWTSDGDYVAHDLGSVLMLRYCELGPGSTKFASSHQDPTASPGYYTRTGRARGLPVGVSLSQLMHTFDVAVYTARVCPLIEV